MPSFPSYYLNNLERKRQRSRELREGLNEGMAGVLGGVDRLAQMQAALEEKGLRAEALKHGRDIEAANQARADQRFAWEGEDRDRKNAQSDQKYWLELQKNATQGNAALGGDPASATAAPGESSSETGLMTFGPEKGLAVDRMNDMKAALLERKLEERGGNEKMAANPVPLSDGGPSPTAAPRPTTAPKPKAAPKPKTAPVPTAKVEPTATAVPENFQPTTAKITELQKKRGEVADMRAASRSLREILKKYDVEDYVGPIDQIGSWISQKTGLQSRESAEVQSTIRRAFDRYRVAVTGAAAGVKEMADMAATVPNMGDRVDAIIGKLDADDAVASQIEAGLDAVLGANDVRATPPKNGAPSAGPLGAASPRDPNETRRAYYERLRAGGMDHQTALAAARGGQ